MKIIDSFHFYQELELLEIRLKYLYDYVDHFIILESSQKFNGEKRDFLFEKNKKKFERYADKIYYYKLDNFQTSYSSLKEFLKNSRNFIDKNILEFMESHNHYPKNKLNWVLDSYTREALHHPYSMYVKKGDIVFLSDIDEIPSINFVKFIKKYFVSKTASKFYVAEQIEFKYFINLMSYSPWYGTIAGLYDNISKTSLNVLRVDSKFSRKYFDNDPFKNGGFHFSSCGGEKLLLSKIESGGHQEFNFPYMKKNIFKRICAGYDSFSLTPGRSLKFIDINETNFIDIKLKKILLSYKHLMLKKLSKLNTFEYIEIIILFGLIFYKRVVNKIMTLLQCQKN
jgi:beta-1,4-mannosyl-glycoprotein beta-1,4-N-acetylglucosaminyltransferase